MTADRNVFHTLYTLHCDDVLSPRPTCFSAAGRVSEGGRTARVLTRAGLQSNDLFLNNSAGIAGRGGGTETRGTTRVAREAVRYSQIRRESSEVAGPPVAVISCLCRGENAASAGYYSHGPL